MLAINVVGTFVMSYPILFSAQDLHIEHKLLICVLVAFKDFDQV